MMRKTFIATVLMAYCGVTLPALADGDPAEGEEVFNKKCKTCHMVGDDAKNRVGPVLNGIVGSPAGKVEGFKYSKAMEVRAAEGLVWTEEELDAYLTKPRDYLKGTKMAFPGFKDEEDRENVIAYLKTFE